MNLKELRQDFDSTYPSSEDLRRKARKRIPRFAYDYLVGGCNEDVNLLRNESDIQQVELMPRYMGKFDGANLKVSLFGEEYSAPFGIAPIGLQGLIWPGATEILAASAFKHNIPFILSTVATSSLERVAELTNSKAWFQLYHPREDQITDGILNRLENSGYKVLVLIADVPSFGFRPRDIKNGLSMPPGMSLKNLFQIIGKPGWALQTLAKGTPKFANLLPYMPKGLNLRQLGQFMDQTFQGRLNAEKISRLREKWSGRLVIKGVVHPEDAQLCVDLGVDGIIVSNHGGRQLDAGQSSIKPLVHLSDQFSDRLTVMMDSGIRSGPDIARSLASGAQFTFLGRPFMYGVGALGKRGGDHTIAMLKLQLTQLMEQIGCEELKELPLHLIKRDQ